MEGSRSQPQVSVIVGDRSERLDSALAVQAPQPMHVAYATLGLRAAVAEAISAGAQWIWALDGSALPRRGALPALLAAIDRADCLDETVLLAGAVFAPSGGLDASRVPWYRRNQIDLAMASARERLLPIRATLGPALVKASAAARVLPAASRALDPGSMLEWTATLLRHDSGFLVVDSEYDAQSPAPASLGVLTAPRLLLGGALGAFDRVRYGYELGERALSRVSG